MNRFATRQRFADDLPGRWRVRPDRELRRRASGAPKPECAGRPLARRPVARLTGRSDRARAGPDHCDALAAQVVLVIPRIGPQDLPGEVEVTGDTRSSLAVMYAPIAEITNRAVICDPSTRQTARSRTVIPFLLDHPGVPARVLVEPVLARDGAVVLPDLPTHRDIRCHFGLGATCTGRVDPRTSPARPG